MEEKQEKYLPIGTLIVPNGETKKLMITGFAVTDEGNPDKTWDYCGCLYPEGVISSEETYLFDHNQIEEVYHLGFSDDEEKEFKDKLNQFMESK